jgi:hypothetical protein
MKFKAEELDLEFMEQQAEDHLTEREALLLGLQADADSRGLRDEMLRVDWSLR